MKMKKKASSAKNKQRSKDKKISLANETLTNQPTDLNTSQTNDQLDGRVKRLLQATERIESLLTRYRLEQFYEYEEFKRAPRKMMFVNLLLGIARGVGFFLGVSFIGAIAIWIISWMLSGVLEIPVIGQFVAEIIKSAEEYLKNSHP